MPKISTHLHLAIKLSKVINISDLESFILGSAYPDSVDKFLEYHYKSDIDSICDLQKFLEVEEINEFNLGYYFHLWIDNHIRNIDTEDISKYDCMICDMPIIMPVITKLMKIEVSNKKQVSLNNIMSLEKEPIPLYLVSNDKKNRYEKILDKIVEEFVMDNIIKLSLVVKTN